jgi:nicotinate-nucleotide adenylyltransferase
VKILVFGGSFDPIHNGHLAMADKYQRLGGFDEVWFTPCQDSRYGKKLTPRYDRESMLKLAFDTVINPTFRVSNAEFECDAHGKMYDLAVYLREKHPTFKFEFLLGKDSWDKINSWYRSKDLTSEFKFVIVPRNEDSQSSTKVRQWIKLLKGTTGTAHIGTPGPVFTYIKERKLYV